VATFRIGVVLGPEGGALAKMLPAFRAGVGGRLGDGRQWMSWIHLRDLVEILAAAVGDARFQGAWNAVAPAPVTNRDFTAALARALGRSAPFAVPGAALKLAYGEAAGALLGGQRVIPGRLETLEWQFAWPRVEAALAAILAPEQEPEIERDPDPPPGYDGGPRPQYRLTHRTRVEAPLEDVFGFFSNAGNLAVLTPPWTDFRFVGAPPAQTAAGQTIDYRLRIGPFPLRWRTVIRDWEPPARMVDVQARGPYRLWWHEHRFVPDGDGTRMEDRVWYRMPFGPLGRLAHRLVVGRMLRRIFGYRAVAIDLRFGRRR
jgi:ligand-binding SRPBCC domain-containing protein